MPGWRVEVLVSTDRSEHLPPATAAEAGVLPAALPSDLSACHAMIRQLLEAQQENVRAIGRLEHQLQQLLRRVYGRSAERIDSQQLVLFEQLLAQLTSSPPASLEGVPTPAMSAPPTPSSGGGDNGHGRRRLPADLPRQRIVHDLPEDQKPCPCCGKMREVIGEETSEQLDYVPAKVTVLQHVRLKYACKTCEEAAAESGPQIIAANKPLAPIEKGLAAPGLLAYVIVSKYSDHLPLHRQVRILERHHIDIARSTLCDWVASSAQALRSLYGLMVQEVLASRIIHTDDTPVDVLDPRTRDGPRNGPGDTHTGRFWVYLGDRSHPYDVFDYTPSRSRDGPMIFLKDWGKDRRVYLQADAFGGYDGIYRGQAGGQVTEVACWAHARRGAYEARLTDLATSTQALAYIRLLYDVEDQAEELCAAEEDPLAQATKLCTHRLRLRQELAVPRLREFRHWLESRQASGGGPVLPKSPMGQAITYVLNQWDALCVYTTDGELSIDNNASENALRRVAVGRKNWLFCGSDNGGTTAAILLSFIATCQRHRVNCFDYLRDVLSRIAATPRSRLAQLLPDRWQQSRLGLVQVATPSTI